MDRIKRHTKKTVVGILGWFVVVAGVIMIPYPGPGWLVVFAGLALLSTEFHFAARLLERLKGFYDSWSRTLQRQHGAVKLGVLLLTGLVVVTTIWLVNGFGVAAYVLHLPVPWLTSPFMR